MATMVKENLSKDWSYLYERLFSKLSDEGFHDMWSVSGFLVVFIFCTLVITLTLAVAFSWLCGWCFQKPTKVGVLLPPPEQRCMQTQTGLEPIQTQMSLSNVSTQLKPQTSMMDPQNPIESVLKPETVSSLQKTNVSSNNKNTKKPKAGPVNIKRKIQPVSRIISNRGVSV